MGEYVIAAILGLIGGAVGSLGAPWAHWGVEKRRLRLQARATMIEEARQVVRSMNRDNFKKTSQYARVRPHLSAKTRELVESKTVFIVQGGRADGSDPSKIAIFDELESLERTWGLK